MLQSYPRVPAARRRDGRKPIEAAGFSEWPLQSGTTVVLSGVLGLLVLGTLERGFRALRHPGDGTSDERLASLGAWWILFAMFLGILLLGRGGVVLAMASLSVLLLRDTLRLVGHVRWYPGATVGAAGAFVFLWLRPQGFLLLGFPAVALGIVAVEWVSTKATAAPRSEARAPAFLIGVAGPLYAAGTVLLPDIDAGSGVGLGWFVLLVVLTELNDSAQAWWGRALGAHRMTPVLSPRKTWEGLGGGVVTTAVAALIVGPLLTPYGRVGPFAGGAGGPPWAWCLGIAVVLAIAGVCGDLLGSRLKRRAGVKDSGDLIPGQGGLLDRLDSLTATAPVFYLATRLLWFS